MTKIKSIKTLSAAMILATTTYTQAFAYGEIACPEGSSAGSMCWECGDNCTAKLETSGLMTFSGSGNMGIFSLDKQPWSNYRTMITSAKIEEGLTDFTYNMLSCTSVRSVEIADSVTKIYRDAFENTNNLQTIIIGANSQIDWIENTAFHYRTSDLNIQCKGGEAPCERIKNRFETDTGLNTNISYFEKYDSDGNPIEIWNKDGGVLYNDKGDILATYDGNGELLSSYSYKYDGAGNLTAAYKNGVSTYMRTSYTPAEAAKAVKKGNNNRVIFTFK